MTKRDRASQRNKPKRSTNARGHSTSLANRFLPAAWPPKAGHESRRLLYSSWVAGSCGENLVTGQPGDADWIQSLHDLNASGISARKPAGAQLNSIQLATLSKQQDLSSFSLTLVMLSKPKPSRTGAPRLAPATAASSRSRLSKTPSRGKS